MKYYISDTHFGHKSIIKYDDRPFKTIEEHDQELIKRWNSIITKADTVYHLGDFAWINPIYYLEQLNGEIHLILGNHDERQSTKFKNMFRTYSHIKLIRDGNIKLILSHRPIYSWEKGMIHLHGHCHGNLEKYNDQAFDISCNLLNYQPKTLKEICGKNES